MNTFGKNIRISLFGESHADKMGITIDGLPAKMTIDLDEIKQELAKRQYNINNMSTSRQEENSFSIISGYFNNQTTGAPLTIILDNNQQNIHDYEEGLIRPSHSDLPYFLKYQGANDYRGGGMSSGRITALLIIVGVIAQNILKEKLPNLTIRSYIQALGDLEITSLSQEEKIKQIMQIDYPFFTLPKYQPLMEKKIIETKTNGDSLGGKVETFIFNCPSCLGEPFFNSFESVLSHLLFSIPAIKGVLFGDGMSLVSNPGSKQIDELTYQNNEITFLSNHQGGINGGITNGNTINFTSIIRAPASIDHKVHSINIKSQTNTEISTKGRHDSTICHRILPVINAVSYWTILDLMIENNIWKN